MSKRYGTLDVGLNLSASGPHKLSRTIDAEQREEEESSKTDNDQKTNKFKELYYKNEKLRRELKSLNEKLNDKLDKLKLPSVKRKTMSVDLNKSPIVAPPSKALIRELENAYKQIAMYKKQVQVLKGKEQTPESYQKLRNTENMINYMDIQINRVQEELKSIKNIKKMQDKALVEDVDNAEIKQRANDYQREIKNFRDKIKDMESKSRKRQKEFKKQQAYLVALKDKIRKYRAEQDDLDKPEPQKAKQVDASSFNQAKQELNQTKVEYQAAFKKIELLRVQVRNIKQQKNIYDNQFKQKQALLKLLLVNSESFTRLLKDLQLKKYEQTGVKEDQPKPKQEHTILKLEEIEDQPDEIQPEESQIDKKESKALNSNENKDEREWKGKMKKVSMGYAMPTDTLFQESGILLGLKVFLDENKFIVGILPILLVEQNRVEAKLQGNATSIEIKWQVTPGDHVSQIVGSFTSQGYLSQLVLKTWAGSSGVFGNPEKDSFHFDLEYGEYFSGIFGGLRRLGQDVRITQIGFWIWKM